MKERLSATRLWFCGDAQACVSLTEAYAAQEGDIGNAASEFHVALGRAGRSVKVRFKPEQPSPDAHAPPDALLFREQKLSGLPSRG